MARITIEDCTEHVGNHFTLVVMASVRSKQIMRGSKPLVPQGENRPVVTSLREIAAGHVEADLDDTASVPTPSASAAPEPVPEGTPETPQA